MRCTDGSACRAVGKRQGRGGHRWSNWSDRRQVCLLRVINSTRTQIYNQWFKLGAEQSQLANSTPQTEVTQSVQSERFESSSASLLSRLPQVGAARSLGLLRLLCATLLLGHLQRITGHRLQKGGRAGGREEGRRKKHSLLTSELTVRPSPSEVFYSPISSLTFKWAHYSI